MGNGRGTSEFEQGSPGVALNQRVTYRDRSAMISCTGLTKVFGNLTAVDQVGFEIHRGEVCTLLGPNGAGKSTLIRMLCGLMRPDEGRVSIAGHDPQKRSRDLLRKIGVVPDTLALLSELTIEEHLEMCGPIYGLDRPTTRVRSEQLLGLLGIYEKRNTLARECSHGMRKKTALAMALLHNPEVVILDEPFEAIDPVSAESILNLFQAISRRGITILLTSHILQLASRMSDRVMMMRAGRLIWNSRIAGEPADIEKLYFELVEAPGSVDLEWLRSHPS